METNQTWHSGCSITLDMKTLRTVFLVLTAFIVLGCAQNGSRSKISTNRQAPISPSTQSPGTVEEPVIQRPSTIPLQQMGGSDSGGLVPKGFKGNDIAPYDCKNGEFINGKIIFSCSFRTGIFTKYRTDQLAAMGLPEKLEIKVTSETGQIDILNNALEPEIIRINDLANWTDCGPKPEHEGQFKDKSEFDSYRAAAVAWRECYDKPILLHTHKVEQELSLAQPMIEFAREEYSDIRDVKVLIAKDHKNQSEVTFSLGFSCVLNIKGLKFHFWLGRQSSTEPSIDGTYGARFIHYPEEE